MIKELLHKPAQAKQGIAKPEALAENKQ